jgi:hypothetical protein
VDSPQPGGTKADVATHCFYRKLGWTTEGKGNFRRECSYIHIPVLHGSISVTKTTGCGTSHKHTIIHNFTA